MPEQNEKTKRVVAPIKYGSYVRLYGLKLREETTLEALMQEAVDLLIETRRNQRAAGATPATD